jgi:hypothetical protein
MPVQDNSTIPTRINPFCAAAEKAVAAQRPFQSRKKPVKRSGTDQAWAGSQIAFQFGRWMNGPEPEKQDEEKGVKLRKSA